MKILTTINFLYNSIYYDLFYKTKMIDILNYSFNGATIYYTRLPNINDKKILIFLAGGVEFRYCNYIDQTLDNLRKYDFPCFVYENKIKLSFVSDKDIADWIRYLCELYPSKEIITIGFSIGGTIASHVISYLKYLPNIKKIIT
jgi:hypothetical protein